MDKERNKGFTILELLVAVAIIGLLASLILVRLGEFRQRSRDAKREEDIKQLQNALEIYHTTNLRYPPCGSSELVVNGSDCFSQALIADGAMRVVSTDPLGGGEGACGDPASFVYCYFSLDGLTYDVRYQLETDTIQGKSAGWQPPVQP